MEWLLANPQIYSAFTALGSLNDGGYVVGDNCLGKIIPLLATHEISSFNYLTRYWNNKSGLVEVFN